MNALETFISEHGEWEETGAMNMLNWNGIVSDEAAWSSDVADCDCEKAVEFLKSLTP